MAITLFPLLVSNTVSKNVVPGVCKVLENYIMVYGLESILAQARRLPGHPSYTIKNRKVIKRENEELLLSDLLYEEILEEQSRIYGNTKGGSKGKTQTQGRAQTPKGKTWQGQSQTVNVPDTLNVQMVGGDKPKDYSARIDPFNLDQISLEPTWMKIDQVNKEGVKTSGIIGIKVVPYLVKSDASLSRLLMYDKQVSKLQRFAITKGRNITSKLYRAWNKLWLKIPFTEPNDTVTGDPRKDIILKRHIHHTSDIQNIFALANQAELSEDFMADAKGVQNLQKMGWGSLLIADDVNRRVAFCMKELKGMCSMMPYTMLYQTFSQAKVYEDLEDAKRTASSIFKVRRERLTKLVGEGVAQDKVEGFGNQNLPLLESNFIQEAEYIDENIASFMKRITPANLKATVVNIFKGKSKIPVSSPEKVVKLATKLNPEFRKGYMLSKKVIANSAPGVSSDVADWAAIFIAIRASVKRGGGVFIEEVKYGLKSFIKIFRRSSAKASDEKAEKAGIPKEHLVDATIGWTLIVGALGVVTALASFGVYAGAKIVDFGFLALKNLAVGLRLIGVDALTMQEASEWGKAVGESLQDYAQEYGAWIALTLMVVAWLYAKAKR